MSTPIQHRDANGDDFIAQFTVRATDKGVEVRCQIAHEYTCEVWGGLENIIRAIIEGTASAHDAAHAEDDLRADLEGL